jgi:hypothetical protein
MYNKIVSPLVQMGYLRDMALVPIIQHPPKNLDSFETFAYNFYKENSFYSQVNKSSSNSSENFSYSGGVYAISSETGKKYHDVNGTTTFSQYNILTPVLEIFEESSLSSLLYNLHSEYNRGKAIDEVIDAWRIGIRQKCAVTPMVQLVQDTEQRPASMLFYPISPGLNDSKLVGFVRAAHDWDTVLLQAVPSGSNRIQIVINDGVHKATFVVSSDSVSFVGWGDVHDKTYDQYSQFYRFSDSNVGYQAFSFQLYPTADFFPPGATVISSISCAALVVLLLLLTVAFIMHDIQLQSQLWQKQEAMNLKQSFVRFISHEIRTPLNTVCIGLKLLVDEVNNAMADLRRELKRRRVEMPELSTTEDLPPLRGSLTRENTSIRQGDGKEDSDSEGSDMLTSLAAKIKFWSQLLKEVEESSVSAVSILNELLSYDKIEQKNMIIEKELLPVWELIATAVKPFNIQARYLPIFHFEAVLLD